MKEARALPVEEAKEFPSNFFFNYLSFLKSSFELSQVNEFRNGNGNETVGGIAGQKFEVKKEANGKVLSLRDWEEMWNYVVGSRFVRNEIKRRHSYITGISVEDLVRDAYVVGIEELKRCRESNSCGECKSIGCAIWERKFHVSFRKALKRLQDLGKRNGRVDYLELVEEGDGEERLPTTYRSDWDLSVNWKFDPLMIFCSQEEEKEERSKEEARLAKVRGALKKLKKREREVWELLLNGISPHEVAEVLGYKRVQGVYMVIRRSMRRLRRFVCK
jgi:DNA-directed RNA polymerase specialized sigma24 family protein